MNWLHSEVAKMWGDWLDPLALSMLYNKGYYSSYHSASNIRFIVLNTQTMDVLNFFLIDNPYDPDGMLEWLRSELYTAERAGQKAFIFGHIPPGDTFANSLWAERYGVLVDRFERTITGQFFAHTHED